MIFAIHCSHLCHLENEHFSVADLAMVDVLNAQPFHREGRLFSATTRKPGCRSPTTVFSSSVTRRWQSRRASAKSPSFKGLIRYRSITPMEYLGWPVLRHTACLGYHDSVATIVKSSPSAVPRILWRNWRYYRREHQRALIDIKVCRPSLA